MLFSSLPFLFGFLPLTMAAVFLAVKISGRSAAVPILLVASLIFYSWTTPVYIFLIASSVLVNFFFGRKVIATRSRAVAGVGIAFNLALLGWFKYIGLFSSTFSDLARTDFTIDGVVLPLAISFFTFQQIAYLADCLKAESKPYSFLEYALFVAFFPQLIAGPIVHHKELTPQFRSPRFASFDPADIAAGLFVFAIGLSKKVLIADELAPMADSVFDAAAMGSAIGVAEAWTAVLAYSFQIYFDFSGYSDMAIGLALLFGVKLPVNFNSPYKAHSITEFWRRWHITLSSFLRDYLYIPLGGNRKGGLARYRNLFIVMLLGGLWHGAAWTFLVWGGLHGAYLCINHAWSKIFGDRRFLGFAGSTALTFFAVTSAWVFFRSESFAAAFVMFSGLLGGGGDAAPVMSASLSGIPLLMIAALIVWRAPNAMTLLQRFQNAIKHGGAAGREVQGGQVFVLSNATMMMTALGALSALAIYALFTSGPYEFIYFQF